MRENITVKYLERLLQQDGLAIFNLTTHETALLENSSIETIQRTNCIVLSLVRKGKVQVGINLKNFVCSENDLIVIGQDSFTQLLEFSDDCEMAIIVFTLPRLASCLELVRRGAQGLGDLFTIQNTPVWTLDPVQANYFFDALGTLTKESLECQSDAPFRLEISQLAFVSFLYKIASLIRQHTLHIDKKYTRKEMLVLSFIKLIRSHSRKERSVTFYADKLCVTPKHLSQVVKAVTGGTAGQIIDYFVILEAKIILNDLNFSISQVAEQLNFSDQSFFGKYFKRHTNMSPKQYRESLL